MVRRSARRDPQPAYLGLFLGAHMEDVAQQCSHGRKNQTGN